MKEGSILASSIYLLKEIILEEKKTSLVIKKYFRQNRFIGSKDKNAIKNLIYKFLKNFYSLKNICNKNNIKFNIRNGLLLLFLNNNKNRNFCFIYDGKYLLKKK